MVDKGKQRASSPPPPLLLSIESSEVALDIDPEQQYETMEEWRKARPARREPKSYTVAEFINTINRLNIALPAEDDVLPGGSRVPGINNKDMPTNVGAHLKRVDALDGPSAAVVRREWDIDPKTGLAAMRKKKNFHRPRFNFMKFPWWAKKKLFQTMFVREYPLWPYAKSPIPGNTNPDLTLIQVLSGDNNSLIVCIRTVAQSVLYGENTFAFVEPMALVKFLRRAGRHNIKKMEFGRSLVVGPGFWENLEEQKNTGAVGWLRRWGGEMMAEMKGGRERGDWQAGKEKLGNLRGLLVGWLVDMPGSVLGMVEEGGEEGSGETGGGDEEVSENWWTVAVAF